MTRLHLPVLFFSAILLLVQACSSTPKTFQPSRSGMKLQKQICIARFEDKKRFDDAYLEQPFQDKLIEALTRKCRIPAFIIPGQIGFPEALETLPRLESGLVDNMALMDIGREHGFNAIVTGVINDIRQSNEIGWLTGERSYFQVTITAEIYDTQTGAKLLDKTYLHEIEVDVTQASEVEKESEYFDIIAIEKLLKNIVADMHTDICDTISKIPWQGFIIGAEEGTVIISAGQKVGLKVGNRLNLYQNNQIITGAFGNQYRIPGPVIGELRLVSVSDDRSEAVLVNGKGAVAGNSVSLK